MAVAETDVAMRDIAEVVAKGLRLTARSLPTSEALEHFGSMSVFAGLGMTASSDWTCDQLGWMPTAPILIADLEGTRYYVPTPTA